jgi:hypothetical protein
VYGFMGSVPLFLPGVVVSILLAAFAARPMARWLQCSSLVAFLLVASTGFIVSATLTPLAGVFDDGTVSSGTCDMQRVGWAPLATYLRPNETSLNVLLFVPLGLALGLMPVSRRARGLIVLGLLSPFAVEGIQLFVPMLGRGCQAADIVDNLTGVVIGMVVGRLLAIGGRRLGA